METRTAPQWIRDREAGYRRARWMWVGATVLGWLGWAGWWAYAWCQPPNTALWNSGAVTCLAGWMALDLLKLEERVKRYGNAAEAVSAAIVRYETSSDLPESALAEADRRAREAVRVERIRTAPDWIRRQRRHYRLRILGWVSPALLALLLQIPAAHWHWRWVRPWQVLSVGLVLLTGAMFKTRKLRQASHILGEAIERYEYESAATQSDLDEAGRWASEVSPG